MSARLMFDAVIVAGRGGGAFVEIPFDVKAEFGSARPKVLATFDGVAYRGTVAVMDGASVIGVFKDIRAKIGKDIGDTVQVTIDADEEPRVVAVPPDARAALERAGLDAEFEKLSYTHQKEHINAIEEAKQPQTRERRIEKMIEMLRARRR